MNFWTALSLATICLVSAIAVMATKFLFPHHRIVAMAIYSIGWIPFLYSISLKKQLWIEHQSAVTSFFAAFWIHFVFGAVMLFTIYAFLVLFPVARSPFIGLSNETVGRYLSEDATVIAYLDERLDTIFSSAEEKSLFQLDVGNLTSEQKQQLDQFWVDYLEVMIELDLLKERYKTFYQLNAISQPELHKQAFKNGYSAFLAQHYYTLSLTQKVTDTKLKTYLNEPKPLQGIDRGTLTMVSEQLTNSDELLRLNAGRTYLATLSGGDEKLNSLIEKYLVGVDASITQYAGMIVKRPLDFLERNAFKLWFPVLKQSALQISYIRTTSRDYHISPESIAQYAERLKPGDILLERREWHATNVGIPGYWTHSALYIGTLDYLNTYFSDLPELEGKNFAEYLEDNFPDVHKEMTHRDEDGFSYSVIESKRPGVILMSLEASANADSLGVLRVSELSKADHFKIIMQAMEHFGKPYDYDFNFVTDTALVCSELVFKAFRDVPQLSIETQEFNGRAIVSPNQFAEKFASEIEEGVSEMELVLFLDGNEKTKQAVEKGVEDFASSWQRPKWHIAKDFTADES